MIYPEHFTEFLVHFGFESASGVPCSYFAALIEKMEIGQQPKYIRSVNEGDAVALACGAYLGGKKCCVFMQNSGLGNAINPLTSLAIAYQIPLLLFISWRGDPDFNIDPPHHHLMGAITKQLLDLMHIPWMELEQEQDGFPTLSKAVSLMNEKKTPVAILIKKGIFEACRSSNSPSFIERSEPLQKKELFPILFDTQEIFKTLLQNKHPDDVILTTTGLTGRSLYAISDSSAQFYMMGSMGCISSIGLGIALAKPHLKIMVLDGDGALLMRAGALATIGSLQPPNLQHILLNNQSYESTGSQKTAGETVDFVRLAQAMHYPYAVSIDSIDSFKEEVIIRRNLLSFIEVNTSLNSQEASPRIDLTPVQIATRLREHMDKL